MSLRPLVNVTPWIDQDYATGAGEAFESGEDLTIPIQVASNTLYHLSGRQFTAPVTVTVRPPFGQFPRQPWIDRYNGSFGLSQMNEPGAQSQRTPRSPWDNSLERGYAPMILLGGYPVTSITEVWLDGVLLPDTAYKVVDYRFLLRVDGEGWPNWQDLTKNPHTDPNTFEITFVFGSGIPEDGKWACRVFAGEWYKLMKPSKGNSRLSARTSSVNRQQMGVVILDPLDFIDKGRTGIPEVDSFIKTYNPDGLRERAQVFSPDIPKPGRTITWPTGP